MAGGIFSRQIGSESAVQLNPIQDDSQSAGTNDIDQSAATIGVFTRGRMDKPFWVTPSNWQRRLGRPKPLRQSLLNEVYLHISDAFRRGTQRILVQRLDWAPSQGGPTTTNDYVIVAAKLPTVPLPKPEIQVFVMDALPSGVPATPAIILSIGADADFTHYRDGEFEFALGVPTVTVNPAQSAVCFVINGTDTFRVLDFSAVTSMADVAQVIETGFNNITPLINVSYAAGVFTVETVATGTAATLALYHRPDIADDITNYLGYVAQTEANYLGGYVAPSDAGTNSVGSSLPNGYYMIAAYKLKDIILDGYTVSVHLDAYNDQVIDDKSVRMTLDIIDTVSREKLYSISGALADDSLDEFGDTRYIGDLAELLNDVFVFTAGVYPVEYMPSLADTLNASFDVNGNAIFYELAVTPSTQDTGAFGEADFEVAKLKLLNTTEQYGYLLGGGSRALGLLSRLGDIAYERAVNFAYDVPSEYTPSQAIAWNNQLAFDTHYATCYWAPIKSVNHLTGGKSLWGSSGANVGMRCARNANRNSFGFARKNAPVAGVRAKLGRVKMISTYELSQPERNDLAKARINYVGNETYAEGSFFVFVDSLTQKRSDTSFLKLNSVAEMSTDLDQQITRFAKSSLQLPMEESIAATLEFAEGLLDAAQNSKWLKPSADLGGNAWIVVVMPSEANPADEMFIEFSACYDGVNRQTKITQTVKRP